MLVIVTGSREFTDERKLANDLELLMLEHHDLFIVVGDCPTGADYFVMQWARWRKENGWPIECKIFEADWNRKCDKICYHPPRFKEIDDVLVPYCPMAGHLRNDEMVEFAKTRPEFVTGNVIGLAYKKFMAKNRGTVDCIKRMKKAEIKVRLHVQK